MTEPTPNESKFFSFSGTLSVLEFWRYGVVPLAALVSGVQLLRLFVPLEGLLKYVVIVPVSVLFLWIFLATGVRRLRHLQKPEAAIWLVTVPGLNILLALYLCLAPGPDPYAPDGLR